MTTPLSSPTSSTLLALHGRMFSGKSTVARLLDEQHGYLWANYTDYGKTLAARALTALLGREVTQGEVIRRKNELRPFIIEALRVYGFDEGNGIDTLLKQLDIVPDMPIAFDNVRYDRQYKKLRPYGFRLVRLVISDAEQERRAAKAGMPREKLLALRQEPSEQPLPYYVDEVFVPVDGKTPTEVVAEVLRKADTLTVQARVETRSTQAHSFAL